MQVIKVPLKNAQEIKRYLIEKDGFEKNYRIRSDDSFIYFPVNESMIEIKNLRAKFPIIELSDLTLKKVEEKSNVKESIGMHLSEEEMKHLKTSFDLVGEIAILEIHDSIADKEDIIAKHILDSNRAIKTIVKKSGIHHGKFRTQDVIHVAGKKQTQTFYTENSTKFEVDVADVYFSPRLATERKRIYKDVKKDEDILVMFSGAGPYPCVLSKNSEARYITGIEINPSGYYFSQKNLRLNKLSNVYFINGDVKEIVPHMPKKIVGLKCSIRDKPLQKILEQNPKLIELWTEQLNFTDNQELGYDKLESTIKKIQEKNIHVVVHQPMDFKEGEKPIHMGNSDIKNPILRKMTELAKEHGVDLIIHLNNLDEDIPLHDISRNVKTFQRFYNQIYFENPNLGTCAKVEEILHVINETGLKKICIDTCHMLHNYSNDEMIEAIEKIQNRVSTYFHISDYKNSIHGGVLDDESNIDLEKLMPFVNKGIAEIISKDHNNPTQMISSWNYLDNFNKKYDRVIMPLPKTADEFLDEAIDSLNDNGIINFYDFLHIDNFDEAVDKIKTACEKKRKDCEILRIVKCGQHAPKIFRICVDARIIYRK